MLWRVIPRFCDYEVSEFGEVRRVGCVIALSPRDHKGYKRFALYNMFGRQDISSHRLVATTYIPNPYNLPQVNHLDGDKCNNHISNLEWCSAKDNMQHAWDNGLMANVPNPPTKKRKLHKLRNPEGEVVDYDIVELSEKLGVGRGKFYQVAKGTRKQHCGYTKP